MCISFMYVNWYPLQVDTSNGTLPLQSNISEKDPNVINCPLIIIHEQFHVRVSQTDKYVR